MDERSEGHCTHEGEADKTLTSTILYVDFDAFVPKDGDLPSSVIGLCQANWNSAFYILSHT